MVFALAGDSTMTKFMFDVLLKDPFLLEWEAAK